MKIISIDSNLKTQGTSDNFRVNFETPFNNDFTRISVLEAQIPKSYYLFNSTDDTTINVVEITGTLSYNITITADRNYTASQLASEIQAKLLAGSLASGNTLAFTCSYVTETGKFLINSGSAAQQFSITPISALMKKYTGITPNTLSVLGIVNSDNVANMHRTDAILIRSSLANNYNDNILLNVYPNNTQNFGVIAYQTQDADKASCELTNNHANSIDIQLMAQDGSALDFNGASITLRCVLY